MLRHRTLSNLVRCLSTDFKSLKSMKIDRSSLLGVGGLTGSLGDSRNVTKESPSPLTKELQTYIKLRGAITIHEYMSQALNHVPHGYYQHTLEKIGSAGDFVTAPEISPVFGELIGVWFVSAWELLGCPSKIQLIEMGPGKGTLMQDILRVANRFPAFKSALGVHMIELSQTMRRYQHSMLVTGNTLNVPSAEALQVRDGEIVRGESGVPIQWHSFLPQVPSVEGVPVLAIGQEFLDAFPVHQFAHTSRGWREKLVDVDPSPSQSPYHFRFVLSPEATPAVSKHLAVAADVPPSTLILPPGVVAKVDVSSKLSEPAQATHLSHLRSRPEGEVVEVSPLSVAVAEDLAARVVRSGGATLLVDYGEDFTQDDTLRGFYKHKQVSVLSQPGRVDVTADVDFSILRRAAESCGASVPPLSTQGDFLMRMGIVDRIERLINDDRTTEEQGEALMAALERLVDPAQMGRKYKVLAITSPGLKVHGFPDEVKPRE